MLQHAKLIVRSQWIETVYHKVEFLISRFLSALTCSIFYIFQTGFPTLNGID